MKPRFPVLWEIVNNPGQIYYDCSLLFCALISYHRDLSQDSVLPRGTPTSPAFPLLLSLTMGTQAGVETKQAAGVDISSMKPQGTNLPKKLTLRH